jgi:hypothetical protein
MQNNVDITTKNYKKLILQVSSNALDFSVYNTLDNRFLNFKKTNFPVFNKTVNNNKLFEDAFNAHQELLEKYDQIAVIHNNNLSTFVPNPLFDEDYLGSYLQYNAKVFETDFFASDAVNQYDMHSVYIPFVNVNNFLLDKFGVFEYKHSSTILVTKLLDLSKNNDNKKMFVHLQTTHFEIVVIQNQKLILFNSFDYKTPEDLIYYILFTAEQLQLNPENFILELLGNITENDNFYAICYKYIRNVSLLNVQFLQQKNDFSEVENRANFILFNS